VSHRRLLVLALIAGLPGFAGAQFTTFIPPQHKVADSIKAAVVAQQKAQTDTSIQTQLANMKTWVDSAAGLVPTPTTPVTDSTSVVVPPTPAAPVATTPAPTPADTAVMRNGARAPATASALPLLLLLGALSLATGVVILLRATPAPAASARRPRDGA
jgi:hypothetical protein